MPPKEREIGEVVFMLDGEPIGNFQTLKTIEFEPSKVEEKELKNGETLRFLNQEYTLTLENTVISQEFLNTLLPINQIYTIVGEGYKLPRGKNLPKRKRIRNKWKKKYCFKLHLDNCIIG